MNLFDLMDNKTSAGFREALSTEISRTVQSDTALNSVSEYPAIQQNVTTRELQQLRITGYLKKIADNYSWINMSARTSKSEDDEMVPRICENEIHQNRLDY